MGKHLKDKHQTVSLRNGPPYCMGSILHIIKYDHWRSLKKRHFHKRIGEGRNIASVGNPETDAENFSSDQMDENGDSNVKNHTEEEKRAQTTAATKNSLKSRLNKGRNYRSLSLPLWSLLTRTFSFHHVKCSEFDGVAELILSDGSPRFVSQTAHDKCGPSEHNQSYQTGEHQKQPIETHRLLMGNLHAGNEDTLEQKSVHVKEIIGDASFYISKEFLDALDIINVNKELLLTILQDPSSSLAIHFSNQQAFGARMRLTRAETFPAPGSSGRRNSGPSRLKNKHKESRLRTKVERGTENDSQTEKSFGYRISLDYVESADPSSPRSSSYLKKLGENKMAIKSFKDLGEKIKHVIKESKKEKNRIIMDATLHKIPHDVGFSKELKDIDNNQWKEHVFSREGKDSPASSYDSDHSVSSISKGHWHKMCRTSSLTDSLDRYCQLYNTSFSKEKRNFSFDRLKLRSEETEPPVSTASKSLGRIYSMPNLESHCNGSEVFPGNNIQENFVEGSELDSGKKDEVRPVTVGNYMVDDVTSSVVDNLVKSQEGESNRGQEHNIEQTSKTILEPEKGSSFSSTDDLPEDEFDDLSKQQDQSCIEAHKVVDERALSEPDEGDIPSVLNNAFPYLQVDAKDISEFNYVRDILELSGFTENRSLGKTWHSNDQPVDPSIYEEVEDWLLLDPDCSGCEEGGKCKHALLFDLINEVLMEIYGRSYSYWPRSLSSLSRIRPMPEGNRVLQEVWGLISWCLSFVPWMDGSLDYIVSRDTAKDDSWLNLQIDCECVGLELEDMIFYDLLHEVIWT